MTSYVIRYARADEIPGILLGMSRNFWDSLGLDEEFDAPHTLANLHASAQSRLLIVLEKDDQVVGFLGGFIHPLICNASVFQAIDGAFWVEPEHRGGGGQLLLDGFESAAKDAGAKYAVLYSIRMGGGTPERAEAIYRKMGYRLAETVWRKEI